jgi:phage I-like protein
MTDEQLPGDSIAAVFPPDDPAARFVVAMGMAKNDIERALRDVLEAGERDRPDFSYRVRLATGHLVEALDSLNAFSQEFGEVRELTKRVSAEGQKKLTTARGTLQQVGTEALKHARDNTFHYPSPKTNYTPTSDRHLRNTLAAMSARRADVHVDYDTKHVTLTFSDEVALALSIGKYAPNEEDYARQFERTRDGALAFIAWAERLLIAYFEATGAEFGEPEISDKK